MLIEHHPTIGNLISNTQVMSKKLQNQTFANPRISGPKSNEKRSGQIIFNNWHLLAVLAQFLLCFTFTERKRFVQITLISIWNDLDSFMDSFIDSFRPFISKLQVDQLVMHWECAPLVPATKRSHEPSTAVFCFSECFLFQKNNSCFRPRPVRNLQHSS